MTIQSITSALAGVEALIAGLSTGQCFDATPDTIETILPVCINVIDRGSIERSAGEGYRRTIHTIQAQLLCAEPGTDLPTAETIARPYVSKFISKLDTNRSLAGTCIDSEVIGYEYREIRLNEGSPGYLGIVFTIEATEEETGATLFLSTSA